MTVKNSLQSLMLLFEYTSKEIVSTFFCISDCAFYGGKDPNYLPRDDERIGAEFNVSIVSRMAIAYDESFASAESMNVFNSMGKKPKIRSSDPRTSFVVALLSPEYCAA